MQPSSDLALAQAAKVPFYTGTLRVSVDDKGRLTIPARWRKDGEKGIFQIHKNPASGALAVLTPEVLPAYYERALHTIGDDEEARSTFQNIFFADLDECPFDAQGRMTLSEDQISHAGIPRIKGKSTEALLAGCADRFDIWSIERRAAYANPARERQMPTMRKLGF